MTATCYPTLILPDVRREPPEGPRTPWGCLTLLILVASTALLLARLH